MTAAARLAEIGAHNVVATVAVENDAVGSAVISLADVAAAAAAGAAANKAIKAEPSPPESSTDSRGGISFSSAGTAGFYSSSSSSSSSSSATTVSVPFSCPVTRLGRLRGRAEGTLVLTFLLPNI